MIKKIGIKIVKQCQTLKIVFCVSKEDKFLRFINFEPQYLSQIPFFFKPLTPIIEANKEMIMNLNSFIGLPWWMVLILASIAIRTLIFPLILVQMRKMAKMGPVAPVFVIMKDTWKYSNLPFWSKVKIFRRTYLFIAKEENFKLRSIFIYNIFYYPILISMIYSIRKIIAQPQVKNASFLYITDFTDIDPYYILPTLTVALYYWNFQRFITPQNKHTLISRIRVMCQIFMIFWYPFLCCWPSGIVIYMCSNAAISILQSNILKSPWLMSKIAKKVMFYNMVLQTAEYDKGTSDSIIEAMKKGEQSIKDKALKEEVLIEQTLKMVQKLNKEQQEQSRGVNKTPKSGNNEITDNQKS